ncbi:MAG: hypothetical protein V2A53_07410 [bacterium]
MEAIARTHVLLPARLLSEIDRIVGKRKRSAFLAEAAKEKMVNIALLKALDETAGVIQQEEHPEWRTRKDTFSWVRGIRERDEEARRG